MVNETAGERVGWKQDMNVTRHVKCVYSQTFTFCLWHCGQCSLLAQSSKIGFCIQVRKGHRGVHLSSSKEKPLSFNVLIYEL